MKPHSTEPPLRRVHDSLQALLCDLETMARVHHAAEAAARVPRGSMLARDFVADVIEETFTGTLTWDPDHVSIATHIIREVRRRASRSRRQQAIFVPLETLRESEMLHEPHPGGDERGSEVGHAEPQVMSKLRVHAADDSDVLKLLAFYEQGKTRRRDVLRLGMSVVTYRAARRRLRHYVSKVLAAAPERLAEPPGARSGAEAMAGMLPEPAFPRAADPMSTIGLLLAATRFDPRRAERSSTIEDRDRRSA